MNIKYAYSNGSGLNECEASDISEIQKHVQQLSVPKKSLYLSPPNAKGAYLDFHSLADGSIEMEIMDSGGINNFATVDVFTASRIVEIIWSDDRNLPLRQKLNDLPMKWLT